jgi:broad specificity phosphatase PhoE
LRRTDRLTIVFETHSTSLDNEAGLASGHTDTDLSPRGERQAIELGERRRDDRFDVVYASDLRRSWRTAEVAFATSSIAVVRDARLRECDYGLLSRRPVTEIDALREKAVNDPFPGGESYAQVMVRVAAWLEDTRSRGLQQVLVIGHRATHYSLEHLVHGVPLVEAVRRSFRWQPGWVYELPNSH